MVASSPLLNTNEPCDATERRQRGIKWNVLGRRPLIAAVIRFNSTTQSICNPFQQARISMSNLTPIPSNHDMWRAYALAPAVTPLTFLAIVSIGGVTLPAKAIALGFITCYLVAGLIGMPIAFSLRRRDLLNALTIHGAAFAWGTMWAFFCTFAAIYVVGAIGGSIQSLPLTTAWFSALMVPPVVLAGTAFWLLVKNPKLI